MDEVLTKEPSTKEQLQRRKSTLASGPATGPPSRRSTMGSGEGGRSRRETIAQATAKYYAPQTEYLSTSHRHRNFARMLSAKGNDGTSVRMEHDELRRFSLLQVISLLREQRRKSLMKYSFALSRLIMLQNCSMQTVLMSIVEQLLFNKFKMEF